METDEIYIGVDRCGVQYVFPVRAKGGNSHISPVQVERNFALCMLSQFVRRPIGAKFADDARIALFRFDAGEDGVRRIAEKHYMVGGLRRCHRMQVVEGAASQANSSIPVESNVELA